MVNCIAYETLEIEKFNIRNIHQGCYRNSFHIECVTRLNLSLKILKVLFVQIILFSLAD